MKKCKVCSRIVKGRSDKIFCTIKCKNIYHLRLRKSTAMAAKDIDIILHRNRSILYELMKGDSKHRLVEKMVLEKMNFHFNFSTQTQVSSDGNVYNWLYDHGWIEIQNDKVLLMSK